MLVSFPTLLRIIVLHVISIYNKNTNYKQNGMPAPNISSTGLTEKEKPNVLLQT